MRVRLKVLSFLILFSACGQREVLLDNNWVLIDATFNGQRIEFSSSDRIFFTDKHGQVIRSLNFGEDETIILPGINSSDIQARWTMQGNKIRFSIDSSRYPVSTFDPNILEERDSTRNEEGVNVLNEFKEPMHLYGQVFEYNISRDTLTLFSKDVKLWAVRDRRN